MRERDGEREWVDGYLERESLKFRVRRWESDRENKSYSYKIVRVLEERKEEKK